MENIIVIYLAWQIIAQQYRAEYYVLDEINGITENQAEELIIENDIEFETKDYWDKASALAEKTIEELSEAERDQAEMQETYTWLNQSYR